MSEPMFEALRGGNVNEAGTLLAAAAPMGTAAAVDLTNPLRDCDTLVPYGNTQITIHAALNMGLLRRNSSNVLEELNPPQTATRQDA
jgi:hypothetical protein